MRRVAAILGALVVVLAGGLLARTALVGEPIQLLTGVDGCWAGGESSSGIGGVLVPDPRYGTAIKGTPIMWPVGFSGLRLPGGAVKVLDREGTVVATTGRSYHMSIGYVSGNAASTSIGGAFPAAANCGYPWDFIDCTAAATATGEPVRSDGEGFTAIGEAKLYCGLWTPPPPPPPPPLEFDVAAVKATLTHECRQPSVLEPRTCEQIKVDQIEGTEQTVLIVWTWIEQANRRRARAVCRQVAAAHLDADGVPLGYEQVWIFGREGGIQVKCTVA